MGPFRRFLAVSFLLFSVFAPEALAVKGIGLDYRPGRPGWNVLNALGRQARQEMQLKRAGLFQTLSSTSIPTANDVGSIAVINDDGTIVVQPNAFDLMNKTVLFTPDSGGYRVATSAQAFDSGLASRGVQLTLKDDDTLEVPLGFSFPFFGRTYTSVFINSDGNLTFTAGDVATTDRDLSRFLTGSPRIAPFFADLNPGASGQVTYTAESGKFTASWSAVPECVPAPSGCAPPPSPSVTAQAVLYADGRVQFSYGTFTSQAAVVGISSGSFFSPAKIMDLSASAGTEMVTIPMAEVFATEAQFSEAAAAAKFYATHDDAYDYLVFLSNFSFGMGNAFAYELNIKNAVTGIGLDVLDYTSYLSSGGHLASVVNMGDLGKFPLNPAEVIEGVSPNSTLSVMGQEAGHRWLAYFPYPYNGNPKSNVLLGRDNAHWSFYFNSDASVMEGNKIRDNGDGTFTTTDVVNRYNLFDQYAMGLVAPSQVTPSFVVVKSSIAFSRGHSPLSGITFSGTAVPVTIDQLMQANGGVRLPAAAVAPQNSRFAFVLINGLGRTATSSQIQQVDTIRAAWEQFWSSATDGRSRADTTLANGVMLKGVPAALLAGGQVAVTLHAASASTADRTFTLTPGGAGIAMPATVTLPAGSREVSFTVTGASAGVTRFTAAAPGHETAEGAISVVSTTTLQLAAVSGDGQTAAVSTPLSKPLVVRATDANFLPVPGVSVQFTANGGATVSPAAATTDANGQVQTTVTFGSSPGSATITAAVSGSTSAPATFTAGAVGPIDVPEGAAVNAASFARAPAPLVPGSIVAIFGGNLAGFVKQATSFPLPATLANVTVQFNGIAAPLFYVSPGQLNVQLPFELTGNTATMTVNNGVATSTPITLAIAAAAPGIFMMGNNDGAVTHADGSLVAATSPAAADEIVSVYCTGLGTTTPAVVSGQPSPVGPPLAVTTSTPVVTIGGKNAQVQFSGLTPTLAGLYQVNVGVPSGLTSGPQNLVITMSAGGETSTSNVVNFYVK